MDLHKKVIIAFFFLASWLLLMPFAFSQAPGYEWVKRAGNSSTEHIYDIAVDRNNNTYVTGSYYDFTSFGSINLASPTKQSDIFVAKYDSAGNVLWAIQGNAVDNGYGARIVVDSDGNSYVTGSFSDTAVIGNIMVTGNGAHNVLVAKFGTNGNTIWAKSFTGIGPNYNSGGAIAIDENKNVYLSGAFHHNIVFDSDTLLSGAYGDLYLAKLDSIGNVIWAKREGGSMAEVGMDMAVDATGNIVVLGSFSGSALFGNSSLVSAGGYDIFICKFDNSGNVLWAKRWGGPHSLSYDHAGGIVVDSLGNSYVTGGFRGAATFNTTALTNPNNATSVFLAKYSPSGNLVWIRKSDNPLGWSLGHGVTIDKWNNLYVGGYFTQTTSFQNTTVTSNGNSDLFVAKYSSTGQFDWVKATGGPAQEGARAIALDNSGNCILAGDFEATVNFDSASVTAQGTQDVYLAKLANVENMLKAEMPIPSGICRGDTVLIPFTASGFYNPGNVFTAQLSTAAGSFSIINVIGTKAGINSDTIVGFVLNGMPTGTGYRVRIKSSIPALIGSDNGTDITIAAKSVAGFTIQLTPSGIV